MKKLTLNNLLILIFVVLGMQSTSAANFNSNELKLSATEVDFPDERGNYHIDNMVLSSVFLKKALKEKRQEEHVYHVFSHGKPGQLLLNGKWSHAKEIAIFLNQNISSKTTEIYIYGCNFARGDIGKEAIAFLEQSLNISIAASTNITGQNGDWILENNSVDMTAVFAGYKHSLGLFTLLKSWFVEASVESEANASAVLTCTPVPGQIDIEGTVYQDLDEDQTLDPGETGNAGIAVEIYQDVNSDGLVDAGDVQIGTANTDATGFYAYTFPPSGSITDDFSGGFTGGAGWTTAAWVQTGVPDINGDQVRMNEDASIHREADLLGVLSATISLDYSETGYLEATDGLIVEICSDGTFTTCQTLVEAYDDFTSGTLTNEAINSNILTASTTLRARAVSCTHYNEYVYVDNIVINYTGPSIGDYVIAVNTSSLGFDYSLTTDNVETAVFTALGEKDCDNNFGYKLADSDGDGVANINDLDDDNDGILDTDEGVLDTDLDGILDYLDLDSDNDKCPDYMEGGGTFVTADATAAGGTLTDGNGNMVTTNLGTTSEETDPALLGVPIVAPATTAVTQTVGGSQDASVRGPDCPCLNDADGDLVCDEDDLDDDNDGILDTDEGAFLVGNVVLDQVSAIPAGTYPNQITNKGLRLSDTSGDFILDIYVGPLTSDGKSANFDTSTGKINSTSGLVNLEFVEFIYTTESSPISFELKQITIDNIGSLDGGTSTTQYRDAFTWAETGTWTILGTGGTSSAAGAAISVVDPSIATDNVGPIVSPDPDGNNDIAYIGDFNGVYNNDPDNTISDVLLNLAGTADGHEVQFDFDEPQTTTSLYVFNSGNTSAIWSFFPQLTVSINQTLGPDTDNDGTPDFLDLDSDNDGCPDFVEGGGTFVPADGTAASGTVTDGNGGMVTTNLGTTSEETDPALLGVPIVAPATTAVTQTIGDSQNASARGAGCPCLNDSDGDLVCDIDDLDDDNDGILDTDEGQFIVGAADLNVVSAIPAGTFPGDPQGLRLSDVTGQLFLDIYLGTNTTPGEAVAFDTLTGAIGGTVTSGSLTNTEVVELVYTTQHSPIEFDFQSITINNIQSLDGPSTSGSVRDAFVWGEAGTWTPIGTPAGAVVSVNPAATDKVGSFVVDDVDGNNVLTDIGSFDVVYNVDNTLSDVLLNMAGTYDGHTVGFDFVSPQNTASLFVFNSGGNSAYWQFLPQLSVEVNRTLGPDTDSDGTPDYVDLDSDNDGCPDFIEGGGSFVTADGTTAGGTLTDGNGGMVTTNLGNSVGNTVGTNGVPTAAGTGQTTGDSQNASVQGTGCPCLNDADGDLVCDENDLDDDNDGILDTDECTTTSLLFDVGWNSNKTLFKSQDGVWEDPSDGTSTYATLKFWEDGNDGVDLTMINGQGDPYVINSGLTDLGDGANVDSTYSTAQEVGDVESDLSLAIADGDYIEYPFQTASFASAGINNLGTVSWNGYNFSMYAEIYETAAGAGTATVLLPEVLIRDGNLVLNTVFGNSYEYYALPVNYYAVSPNTDYTVRVYYFNPVNSPSPTTLIIDDFQIGFVSCDTDGDGVPNFVDLDSDNDGCPDFVEGGGTFVPANGTTSSGTVSGGTGSTVNTNLGTDVGTNGVPTAAGAGQAVGSSNLPGTLSASCDSDGDGVQDSADIDSDNDGIPDDVENATASNGGDTDGDGIPDYLDLDSDNDGIPDLIEAGGTDTNGDGVVDDACNVPSTCDADGDGLMDSVDAVDDSATPSTPTIGTAGTKLPVADTDGDGRPDFQDLDADNDGINDIAEAGITDTDNNGIVDQVNPDGTLTADLDGDGFSDSLDPDDNTTPAFEASVTPGITTDPDSNSDGLPDDDDNDGTAYNADDTDGDGTPDFQDLDSDNDGIHDVIEGGNGTADTNGDGTIDSDDTGYADTDGDGIPDTVDQTPNDYGDGNTGTPNTAPTDTDGDNVPDYQDLDSDNDSINDVIEGGNPDPDGDGLVTNPTTDTDGDGIPDSVDEAVGFGDAENDPSDDPTDSDSDGTPDSQEVDSDGDGTNDIDDADNPGGDPTADANNDGVVDVATDTDGDGIADVVDGNPAFGDAIDTDGDGVLDINDIDSDNDGIPDDVENATASNGGDTDGDGIPDYLDLDSDNDGIPDLIEAGGTDTNGDGVVDDACNVPSTCDADGDGLMDSVDAVDDSATPSTPTIGTAGTKLPVADTDGDGRPDFQDLDADNDGINDIAEAGITDTDNNGIVDQVNPDGTLTADVDGDGFSDSLDPDDNTTPAFEASVTPGITTDPDSNSDGLPDDDDNDGTAYNADDTDGDGTPDFQDLDSDNDGIHDVIEGGNGTADTNGDGTIDSDDTGYADTDGDGIPDTVDQTPNDYGDGNTGTPNTAPTDTDGDNVPDYQDLDSDNDSINDVIEGGNPDPDGDGLVTNPTTDTDGDGIPDSVDEAVGFGDAENDPSDDPTDSDSDGTPDSQEVDSDGDGTNDIDDADNPGGDPAADANNDGVVDVATDTDGDGIADVVDGNPAFGDAENTASSTDDFNNTTYETPVSADVSTNDVDAEGDTQTFTLDGANGGMNSADGTVMMNTDGSYTFTPAATFSGETSFQYSVCDDGSPIMCDTATVYFEVLEPITAASAQVIANLDANTVEEGQTGTGNVLSNDLDPDGLSPSVTTTLSGQTVSGIDENGNTVPNAGSLTLNSDGTYAFVPTPGFTGTVTQGYTICDAAIPAISCDDTELIFDVIPDNGNTTFANDDAVMTDAGIVTTGNVSENDTDSEDDAQTIDSYMFDTDGDGDADATGTVGAATQIGGTDDQGNYVANAGEFTLNADGTYTFEPATGFAGNVVLAYTTCDDAMPTPACEEATLVFTILDVKRDYGDSPALYPSAWHRKMTDVDSDGTLDGANDVWLGSKTSFETSQSTSPLSDGDSNDDALTFGTTLGDFPTEIEPSTAYKVAIRVNSASADVVHYGLWIDWDKDGTYDNFYPGSQVTASPATDTVTITTPASFVSGSEVNIRLRADDEALASTDFQGGKSNGEVEDYQSMPIVLPVELSSFKAKANGCNIDLTWVTESEKDFDYFDLEWSGNGQDFRSVGIIEANGGNFNQVYKYQDRAPSYFNYYRLKMVDLDGSTEYSDIVSVSPKCEDERELNIYPNPTSKDFGILNVEFFSKKTETQILITDMLGRVVRQVTFEVEVDFVNTVQIDISELPSGSYTMQILGDKASKMFTIQE